MNASFGKTAVLGFTALIALHGAALAQSPSGTLDIPENPRIFAQDNPNLRQATALVNGEIITGTDIDQRIALVIAANEGQIPADQMQGLRLQVLRNLIDETLQIQKAREDEIEVEDAEINETYARVAQQNFGQNTQAMDAYLLRIGSSPASLKRQIRGELSWQRLIRRNIQPRINVSDEEVNEIMARLNAARGTHEYRIAEIFLAANMENREQVLANMNQIVEQLRQGANFTAMARLYSQATTGVVGGDLGWVRPAVLPPEMAEAVQQMQPGQLVGPIEIRGGFVIVYLVDKRQVLMPDPRDALLSLKQISISFDPSTTEAAATQRVAEFAAAMQNAGGCGGVDAIAAGIGATVISNDQIRARELPAPLQDALLNMSLGQTSPPFGSLEQGVRVLMLCGRDDPPDATAPNFDQIMANLEEDRLNKAAQYYLRDLRREAVIDYN